MPSKARDPDDMEEIGYLAIRADSELTACRDFGDPDFYVHDVTGSVVLCDANSDRETPIGSWTVIQVDASSALAQGVSVFDVFDTQSSTFAFYEALYEDSFPKDSVLKTLRCEDEYVGPGLLILDRLVISPAYRGLGHGLDALRCMMQRYRLGAGLIALKTYPLQFESNSLDMTPAELSAAGLAEFAGTQRSATAKLRRHYRQLGFKLIPRTSIMAVANVHPLSSEDM